MRLKQLDVLRGIAILLVLGTHMYLNETLSQIGWIGVDLFFVLSGFLVSGLLFAEYKKYGDIKAKHFLIRRGLKIYPAFYFLWLVTIVVIIFLRGHKIPTSVLLSEFFFVQNYGTNFWPQNWSLAVEEHFYLLLIFSMILLCKYSSNKKNPFTRIPQATLVISIALLILRVLTRILITPFDFKTHYYATHLRLDSLQFGVCLSYFHHFYYEKFSLLVKRWSGVIVLISSIMISSPAFYICETFFMSTVGFSFLYLGFGGIMVSLLYSEPRFPKAISLPISVISTGLARIGLYSYSIYLWHIAVRDWGMWIIHSGYKKPIDFRIEFLIYVVLSIAVGIFTAKIIEQPVLRLRDRFYPARNRVETPLPDKDLELSQKAWGI